MRWERALYTGEPVLDVPYVGRYIIRRVAKRSREYRAFLNNERTSFIGTIPEVKKMVERVVRANDAPREQEAV